MLVSTLKRNLNGNLTRMDKLQNQMATGRKFAHISDDPISLIYGQAARNRISRLNDFQRSVQSAQDWLIQAEDGLMERQRTFVHAYEAAVDAANDPKGTGSEADKRNIAPIIAQLRDNILDTLNSTFGDRFVFSGYNTPCDPTSNLSDQRVRAFTVEGNPPSLFLNGFNLSQFDGMNAQDYHDLFVAIDISGLDNNAAQAAILTAFGFTADVAGVAAFNNDPRFTAQGITLDAAVTMHRLMYDVLTFDVGPGISMPVTINGADVAMFMTPDENGVMVMRNAWNVMQELYERVDAGLPAEEIGRMIKPLQDAQNHLLTKTAEIGGRVRRLELLESRYEQDAINYERMRSDAEDVDMAEVIIHLKMAEAIYQASLSAGARIIQPTLMDFLR